MRQHPLGRAVEDVLCREADSLQAGENIGLAASAPPDGLIFVDAGSPIASARISCWWVNGA